MNRRFASLAGVGLAVTGLVLGSLGAASAAVAAPADVAADTVAVSSHSDEESRQTIQLKPLTTTVKRGEIFRVQVTAQENAWYYAGLEVRVNGKWVWFMERFGMHQGTEMLDLRLFDMPHQWEPGSYVVRYRADDIVFTQDGVITHYSNEVTITIE